MPHTATAKKRLRQAEKRNFRNRTVKHEIKTQIRKVTDAIENNDLAAAEEAFRLASKKIDKASVRRILHPNTAARRKSLLARGIAKLKQT